MHKLGLTLALILFAVTARAENIALIFDTRDYQTLPDPISRANLDRAESALMRRGFQVVALRDQPVGDQRAEIAALQARLAQGDVTRLVIVLSGWFVSSDSGAWFLPSDADQPQPCHRRWCGDPAGYTDGTRGLGATPRISGWSIPGPRRRPMLGRRAAPRACQTVGRAARRGRDAGRPAPAVLAGLDSVLQPGHDLVRNAGQQRRGCAPKALCPRCVPFLPEGFAPVAQADRGRMATVRATPIPKRLSRLSGTVSQWVERAGSPPPPGSSAAQYTRTDRSRTWRSAAMSAARSSAT